MKRYEEIGYILPPKKSDYPYWIDDIKKSKE
jgi:hypothetical protein